MFKKKEKKAKRCNQCYSRLTEEYKWLGCCQNCLKKEAASIKKYFLSRSIVGGVLALIIFAAIGAVRANYEKMADTYSVFEVGIVDFLALNGAIAGLSPLTLLIICLVVFLIPFGFYPQFGGTYTAGYDAVGIIFFELVISVVTGPFFILFQLYRLILIYAHAKETGVNFESDS